jgi:hypothetical protein
LRWISGFASLTPSLGSCTIPSSRRLCTWPSSFMGPPVIGGLISPPLFRIATRCHGLSSARPSADTITLQAIWLTNFRSSCTYSMVREVSTSTSRGLTTSRSMDPSTLTLMRRRRHFSIRDSVRCCVLNELVSASIKQKDVCCARMEEERKKRPLSGPTGGALPKYCQVYTPSGQPRGHPLSQ